MVFLMKHVLSLLTLLFCGDFFFVARGAGKGKGKSIIKYSVNRHTNTV